MAAVPSIGRAARVEGAPAPEADLTRALYESYANQIFRYCLHQLGSREEAEDAVQSTFLNAFRGIKRGVVPELESAWLFKIAHNVCLSRRRSTWRRGRVESPADFDVVEEMTPAPSRRADELMGLQDVLEEMPENQRRAILLREWQGLSYREIAEELELSQAAVETLIFRARRALAAGLEEPPEPKRRLARGADLGNVLAGLKTLLVGGSAAAKVAATVAVVSASTVVATAPVVQHQRHSHRPPHASSAAALPVQRAGELAVATSRGPASRFPGSAPQSRGRTHRSLPAAGRNAGAVAASSLIASAAPPADVQAAPEAPAAPPVETPPAVSAPVDTPAAATPQAPATEPAHAPAAPTTGTGPDKGAGGSAAPDAKGGDQGGRPPLLPVTTTPTVPSGGPAAAPAGGESTVPAPVVSLTTTPTSGGADVSGSPAPKLPPSLEKKNAATTPPPAATPPPATTPATTTLPSPAPPPPSPSSGSPASSDAGKTTPVPVVSTGSSPVVAPPSTSTQPAPKSNAGDS